MSYDTEVVKICRLSNGWTVDVYDPSPAEEKAEKKMAKGDMAMPMPYKDPWRTMAFGTFEEVLAFLAGKGKDLKPRNFDEEYAKSFNETVSSINKPKKEKAK